MVLDAKNYYSKEANLEYMSVSTYKDFAGTIGYPGCEYQAYEKLMGRWTERQSDAMLIGSYVDARIEGQQAFWEFCDAHPELYKADGSLYKKYEIAETALKRIKRDERFMDFLSGEKQVIMTGELFGRKWKIKMDSYCPGKVITDLKVVQAIYDKGRGPKDPDDKFFKMKVDDGGPPVNWILYWGYDIQGAIYQEIVRQNTGEKLPFAIAAVSKHEHPEIAVIHPMQWRLDEALLNVEYHMQGISDVLDGRRPPDRCEACDCCKDSKVIPTWESF